MVFTYFEKIMSLVWWSISVWKSDCKMAVCEYLSSLYFIRFREKFFLSPVTGHLNLVCLRAMVRFDSIHRLSLWIHPNPLFSLFKCNFLFVIQTLVVCLGWWSVIQTVQRQKVLLICVMQDGFPIVSQVLLRVRFCLFQPLETLFWNWCWWHE